MPYIRNTIVRRYKQAPEPHSWTARKLFDALEKGESLCVDVAAWMRATDVNCHHSLVMRLERRA